jgi:hypothetical protein
MAENSKIDDGGATLLSVVQRLKSTEIGNDLYIGVEAWPAGAWSVVIPEDGRRIFEIWLADLKQAIAASKSEVDHG